MSIKSKALLMTAGMFVFSAAAGTTISLLINYGPTEYIVMGLVIGVIFWLFYMLYQTNITRLESEARLKELTDKRI